MHLSSFFLMVCYFFRFMVKRNSQNRLLLYIRVCACVKTGQIYKLISRVVSVKFVLLMKYLSHENLVFKYNFTQLAFVITSILFVRIGLIWHRVRIPCYMCSDLSVLVLFRFNGQRINCIGRLLGWSIWCSGRGILWRMICG